ncbi:MAG: phosphoribosylanthranilate isomerase [Planctomycetia bacterium]|nr:phosphoribosylanthranilate isomerase [Planctomycetia bacterium]
MIRLKICGLSRPCDIDFVNEAKPDFVGFVFAKSRRQVTAKQAATLRRALLPGIVPVGVFVNEPLEMVEALCRDGVVEWVQLHGNEDARYVAELREKTDAPIIRAFRVDSESDLETCRNFPADFLLLDHAQGGTGTAFDWNILRTFGEKWPDFSRRVFLAGGIRLENVLEARTLRPYALDTSSGVETDGFKDRRKILELVKKARA